MEHVFDVHVTKRHTDASLRLFLWQEISHPRFFLALLVTLLISGSGWLGTCGLVLLGIIGVFPLLFWFGYRQRKKEAAELLERLDGGAVNYRLDESTLVGESSVGLIRFEWERYRQLLITPEVTLLFYASNAYHTLPTDQVPADSLRYLRERIKAGGGKALDKRRPR